MGLVNKKVGKHAPALRILSYFHTHADVTLLEKLVLWLFPQALIAGERATKNADDANVIFVLDPDVAVTLCMSNDSPIVLSL